MGNSASQAPAVRLNLSLKDCLVFNCCVKSPTKDDDDINTPELEDSTDSSSDNVVRSRSGDDNCDIEC